MRGTNEGGIVLVIVLWAMALLAVIAGSFTTTTRSEANLARNLVENAKAEALAEAGVYGAILALLRPESGGRLSPEMAEFLGLRPESEEVLRPQSERSWRADGTVYAWPFRGGDVRVSIQDEGGKIDLNHAPGELLRGLFQSVGLDDDAAAAMADAVADFRDGNDLRRLNGAEDDDYRRAGLPYEAKDRPFEAVEELQRVMGMTRELYRQVAPSLTVYSESAKIDPMTAPREVLLAVPGADPAEVDAFLATRAAMEGPIGREALPLLTGTRGYFSVSNRLVHTVRAEAHTVGGAVFVREAVVRLTRDPNRPFRFHAWKQGERAVAFDEETN